ncbi:MAG: thiol peroxidase [Bacteroidia bacterium]|nr:thiol peroxidase [Bacteroidia bacterium]
MASITLKGNPIETAGNLPAKGSKAPNFTLTKTNLSNFTLDEFQGKTVILNIFPSIDTGICAASTRRFNQEVQNLENTVVICVSKDLPFAHARFCGAEGLKDVISASEFRNSSFSDAYHVLMTTGNMAGLMSRAVVVINPEGIVTYTEQVPEIGQEPDYAAAMAALG